MTQSEQRREETRAAALWDFIQRIRDGKPASVQGLDGMTPGEAQEMLQLCGTAQAVGDYLDGAGERPPAAAETRVQAAIAARSRRTASPRPTLETPKLQTLRLGMALAALAAGVLIGRAMPPPPAQPQPTGDALPVLSHSEVLRAAPAVRAGTLPPERSRAVFLHLAQCDHCRELFLESLTRGEPKSARLPALPHIYPATGPAIGAGPNL